MATLDECLASVPPDVRKAIEDIAEAAGTYDADWQFMAAAGALLASARRDMKELLQARAAMAAAPTR